jgi:hypothetical protein
MGAGCGFLEGGGWWVESVSGKRVLLSSSSLEGNGPSVERVRKLENQRVRK